MGVVRWVKRMTSYAVPVVETTRIVLAAHLDAEQHDQGLRVYGYILDAKGDEIRADPAIAQVLRKLKLSAKGE